VRAILETLFRARSVRCWRSTRTRTVFTGRMVGDSYEAAFPGSGTAGRLVSGDQLSSSVGVTLLVSLSPVPLARGVPGSWSVVTKASIDTHRHMLATRRAPAAEALYEVDIGDASTRDLSRP
jgi:hypothetical protein